MDSTTLLSKNSSDTESSSVNHWLEEKGLKIDNKKFFYRIYRQQSKRLKEKQREYWRNIH